jgi:hypothetical protein
MTAESWLEIKVQRVQARAHEKSSTKRSSNQELGENQDGMDELIPT